MPSSRSRADLGVRIASVVGAALLLIAGGVALAPAAWLDRAVAARTDGRIRFADASGVWWRGRGSLVTADGAARVPLSWRVAFASLLGGKLDVVVGDDDRNDDAVVASLRVERDGIRASGVRLRGSAASLIAVLAPALESLGWGGEITLRAPSLAWRETGASGELDATWQRARVVAGTTVLDFGTVSASAAPAGAALAGRVRNSGGDIAVDGSIGAREGQADAAITLKARDTAPADVRQMLSLLGAADGAGGVRIEWRSAR